MKDEDDYVTGDGSHVKISSFYDHVFEGEDGTSYAGSEADGPPGSTELFPSQIRWQGSGPKERGERVLRSRKNA